MLGLVNEVFRPAGALVVLLPLPPLPTTVDVVVVPLVVAFELSNCLSNTF